MMILLISLVCLQALLTVSVQTNVTFGDANALPKGHPDRCFNMLGGSKDMYRLEGLPGTGWDNLQNKDMGTVVEHTYDNCRTTGDGRYLIPDGISTIPVKASGVDTVAEYFEHWDSYTSLSSKSINFDVGVVGLPIGGKFSSEYESIKKKQQFERSTSTRMQLRYLKYTARVDNGYKLHPAFKKRVKKIAAHLMLNRTRLATYESQLLVRDYGTHVINYIELGATLVKIDQLQYKDESSSDSEGQRMALSASATVFFEEIGIHAGVSYSDSSSDDAVNKYKSSRLSSEISTLGGATFKPNQFSVDDWSESIDNNLVVLDKSGDPLYFYINEENISDLPEYIIEQVHNTVKKAIYHYYKHNVYRGCTLRNAPNFSFKANVNDGKCKPPKTNFTFGGVFQKCSNNDLIDPCQGMSQKNPLTGDYKCPKGYQPVLVKKGTKSSQYKQTIAYRCGHWWHHTTCAKTVTNTATADYEAYWCAASGTVGDSTGYMFGGLFTEHTDNIFTQTKECPAYFTSLKILDDLTICVSDDYEQGSQFLLPFAGLFSCAAGNPLAVDASKRFVSSQQAAGYPHICPYGYSQHLAVVDDGCEVEYCIKSGAMVNGVLPKIKTPPYMSMPLDMPKKSIDETSVTVFSNDGTDWSTLEDVMENAAQNITSPFKFVHAIHFNSTNLNSLVLEKPDLVIKTANIQTSKIDLSALNPSEKKPVLSAKVKPLHPGMSSSDDSLGIESRNTQEGESSGRGSEVTIAVVSVTGTLLCVLIVFLISAVYRRKTASHPYQKI